MKLKNFINHEINLKWRLVVNTRSLRTVTCLFILFLFLGLGKSYAADERELNVNASDKIDAVLVLDTSGSMLATDPLKLRQEGAKLLVQFLKSGDRLSVVTFAEKANVVRELTDYDPAQQDTVGQLISSQQSTGQYTNLFEGIRLAQSILQNNVREGVTPAIVLMSDGKMEPEPGSGLPSVLTDQLVDTILPDLKKSGVKVYTLAFSEQADKDFLQEIAALTDGISWFTPTADKIHESFASLFLAVKKPQVVPQTKKGFKLDADVQEATFYINREEAIGDIVVASPDGRKITPESSEPDIKWFRGQKFDVVTIIRPKAGDWNISGVTNNDGFATVLTNLKLLTEWPSNVNAEETVILQARLYEDEKPIALPEMSGVVKYAFQITPTDKISEPIIKEFLHDDGSHGDSIEKDGIFSAELRIDEPGEYKLRVLAKGPTFERNQQIPFRVKPALVSISVIDVEEAVPVHEGGGGEHGEHGEEKPETTMAVQQYFRVELADDVLSYKRSDVKLIAVDEKHLRYELPLEQSKTNRLRFETPAAALPKDGEYEIQAILVGESKKNSTIRTQSRTITYQRIKPKHEPEQKAIAVVVEKPKEDKPNSPIIPILLMTILQAAAFGGLFTMLKKMNLGSGGEGAGAPTFPSLDGITEALNKLKQQASLADLDLTLPIFTDPNYELKPVWLGGMQDLVATGGVSKGSDAKPAEAEIKPDEAASAPKEAAPEEEAQAAEEGAAEGNGEAKEE